MEPPSPTEPASDLETLMATIRAEVRRRKAEIDGRHRRQLRQSRPSELYRWGERLTFQQGGNGLAFLREGWSGPEPGYTWSSAPVASIELPIEFPKTELLLSFEAHAFTFGELNAQRVLLQVEGNLAAEWSVTSKREYVGLILHRHIVPRNWLLLEFQFPEALSPHSVGAGADTRHLGMALATLSLRVVDPT